MAAVTQAVLLSCHGTVEDLDDLAGFLLRIRRGRPVPDELLAEVRHRYEVIGGSPLHRTTSRLADKLASRVGKRVFWAARLWKPEISEVLAQIRAREIDTVISVPLAPQSVEVYHAAVREAAEPLGLTVRACEPYGLSSSLLSALVTTIEEALASAVANPLEMDVVLSAHSLPLRIIRAGDRYETEFRAMANAVGERLAPRVRSVRIAFQSQGASNEPWLGPDLDATFRELRAGGSQHVLVAPIGFVAEHVETLYDLDIEAKALAAGLGFASYSRARALDDRDAFVLALAEVVARVEPSSSR